jgi:hypothetical protein
LARAPCWLGGITAYGKAFHIRLKSLNRSTSPVAVKIRSPFRPVYLGKYLETLDNPETAGKKDASWTLGAVICTESNCLKAAAPPT